MSESDVAAIRAAVEELIRSIARLESAAQRNFENVNITRHGGNNNHQLVMTEIGLLKLAVSEIGRAVGVQTAILTGFNETKVEARGGWKMAQFLWPVLLGLGGAVGGYLLRGMTP